MALVKLSDFDPNYRDQFDGADVKGLDVYAETTNEKVGSVSDVLLDENEGRFRYMIVDLGFWIFGKKVLLPVGRSRIDYNAHRVYATGFTKEQAENLPEFKENMKIDYDHEEEVRNVYRTPMAASTAAVDPMLTSGTAVDPTATSAYTNSDFAGASTTAQTDYTNYDRDSYKYDYDADLYNLNDRDHQTLRLYEERLVANKHRAKTGEVAVGKHVETETARVSVPVEKERVVIERVTPTGSTVVNPGEADFREGEVARVEVYEETPDIHKEAFVREEVRIKKEVDRDVVDSEEQIHREKLDIDTQGNPVVERTGDNL
ncbi:DUF2382 domain-containing protein [Leptolyngbya sp. FACHB-261]|uniref:DUF2382 domain-containing protein n=1 Tax=Leptolyngbya sp. FACHB-261 TaxID=2692806 RepID=UPI001688CB11|nr:DUF2382 domain-containing protein [Leptolyngbya sp. FACHB-261]MBD2101945.1 DUF2382 domain-containing protein [Leptolyngbya sp. FACHB-261]